MGYNMPGRGARHQAEGEAESKIDWSGVGYGLVWAGYRQEWADISKILMLQMTLDIWHMFHAKRGKHYRYRHHRQQGVLQLFDRLDLSDRAPPPLGRALVADRERSNAPSAAASRGWLRLDKWAMGLAAAPAAAAGRQVGPLLNKGRLSSAFRLFVVVSVFFFKHSGLNIPSSVDVLGGGVLCDFLGFCWGARFHP